MATPNRQRLLIDTDAYCKLGLAELLSDAILTLGVQVEQCGRLAALPSMLRRGGLRRRLGSEASDRLADLAQQWPLAIMPSERWLDPLVSEDSIDPGEAQLLAAAAEYELLIITGDKRGLEGIKQLPDYAEALNGRVVVLEAIVAELCVRQGVDRIWSRIQPVKEIDKVLGICFSGPNPKPLEGLRSYYRDLAARLEPLSLWSPSLGVK